MGQMVRRNVPWTRQPQVPRSIDRSNPLARGLVDVIDLSGFPRSLILGTPTQFFGTKPKHGVPTHMGMGQDSSAAFGSCFFQRNDGLYAPVEQTHMAIMSIDDISGSGYDGCFTTASGDGGAASAQIYFGSQQQLFGPGFGIEFPQGRNNLGIMIVSYANNRVSLWWNGKLAVRNVGVTLPSYSTSRLILNGERTTGPVGATKGKYLLHSFWSRGITDDEAASLTSNPWQIFGTSQQAFYASAETQPPQPITQPRRLISRNSYNLRQPPSSTSVNWGNPISKDLRAMLSANGGALREWVTGSSPILNSGSVVTTSEGFASKFDYHQARFAHNSGFDTLGEITVFAITTPEQFANYGHIVSKNAANNVSLPYELRLGTGYSDSNICWVRANASGPSVWKASSANLLTAGQRSTIAVMQGDNMGAPPKFIVNGTEYQGQAEFVTASGAATTSSGPLYLGNRGDDITPLHGTVEIVMIFGRILSSEEIRSLSANPWQLFNQANKRFAAADNTSTPVPNPSGRAFSRRVVQSQQPVSYSLSGKFPGITYAWLGNTWQVGSTGVLTSRSAGTTYIEQSQLGQVVRFNSGSTTKLDTNISMRNMIPPGTSKCTISVLRKCHDSNNRASCLFGADASGQRVLAHAPWEDGNLYWDFGDINAGRMSLAFTKTTEWEVLTFVSDPSRGLEVWRNGRMIGNRASSRSMPEVVENFAIGVATTSTGELSDNQSIALVVVALDTWTPAQIYEFGKYPTTTPWQIFAQQRKFVISAEVTTVTRPSSDITYAGWSWTDSTASASIGEQLQNDGTFATSPALPDVRPLVVGLSQSLAAGTYQLSLSARGTVNDAKVVVELLDSSSQVVGTSQVQTLSTVYQVYPLLINTTGTAVSARLRQVA